MAIITTAEVQTILQISTLSDEIDALIPIVQRFLTHDFLKNRFLNNNVYYYSSSFVIAADSITDPDAGFIDKLFIAGMDLHISGGYHNHDVIVEIDTVAAGTLALATGNSLTVEDEGAGIRLTKVEFDPGIKVHVARLIKFDLVKRDPALKSWRLADWSETFAGEGDYPPSLLKSFHRGGWVKMGVLSGE